MVVKAFVRDDGLYRASALAFHTALGLVPLLAFLVSALKGLGAYQTLIRTLVRPGIIRTMISLGANKDQEARGLLGAFLDVIDLVERASFGALGALGLVLFLYVVVTLMVSIEHAMNHIFGVGRGRTFLRRVTDYSAILFITPICTVVAASAAAGTEQLHWLRGGAAAQVMAVLLMAAGLSLLYLVMPYRRVRPLSALLGGGTAGILWYLALIGHVRFQVGVARYSALYSTFAAIPLMLVWIFVSWIVVLIGAEVAAAHQNPALFAWRLRSTELDHAGRVALVLGALLYIAKNSLSGRSPVTLQVLAAHLGVPMELVRTELKRYVDADVLGCIPKDSTAVYLPARDLGSIGMGDLLDQLDGAPSKSPMSSAAWQGLPPALAEQLRTGTERLRTQSLRELALDLDDGLELMSNSESHKS